MRTDNNRPRLKAQSIAEYAVLVAVVIMAFGAMSVYAQRGLQGRYRDAVQAVADQGPPRQYEPLFMSSEMNQTFAQHQQKNISPGDVVESNMNNAVNTSMTQDIALDRTQ